MTRDETVALFLQGREAWNAWAEKMLAERKALEDAGKWSAERNDFGALEPKNDETRAWMDAAAADFSFCHFHVRGMGGTEVTAGVQGQFESAESPKSVPLDQEVIDFSDFKIPCTACFWSATFSGVACFRKAIFSGAIDFQRAAFSDDTFFRNAAFGGVTKFSSATFAGIADFGSTTFADSADFWSTTFQQATIFSEATFEKNARFTGIKVDRVFTLTGAKFLLLPAFNQADFKQAPDLDDVRFPLPGYCGGGIALRGKGKDDEVRVDSIARYRAIRRMAIQGANYEREQMAFKGELRAKRWTVDKLWHPGLWLGLLYDGVADCGRSIVRPAGVWVASIFVFAAFYWLRAVDGLVGRCGAADSSLLQALYLSVKNALVVFGGTRDARVNQAYLCLYDGTPDQPHIPTSVTYAETLLQFPISATLIFLFLLAVKNRFKIK